VCENKKLNKQNLNIDTTKWTRNIPYFISILFASLQIKLKGKFWFFDFFCSSNWMQGKIMLCENFAIFEQPRIPNFFF